MPNRGFTLLELLVVIAIIGVLASIVIAALNPSRQQARNTTVVSQMYEYKKALDLYYSETGRYPNSWPNTTAVASRDNILCIGVGAPIGSGVANQCVPFADSQTTDRATGIELDIVPNYVSEIVHIDYGVRSSPAYRGCSDICTTGGCPATQCTEQSYSLFYMLEGNDQDCGRGIQVDNGTSFPGWTWCQISSAQ